MYLQSVTVNSSFESVLASVRAALADQGFGVLTEIDIRATLKKKLDVDRDPMVILGACNPVLANQALTVEPSIGVLLPCSVVVRADGPGQAIVEVIDPATLVVLTGNQELTHLSEELAAKLNAVMHAIGAELG